MDCVVVLGAGGTVGSAFCGYVEGLAKVHRWDRRMVPLDNFENVGRALEHLRPDIVYNFAVASDGMGSDAATINLELPLRLADLTRRLSFRLIQTSSVLVFASHQEGPFEVGHRPEANEGYGLQKRLMEEGIAASQTNSVVLRLGWQIGDRGGSNTMVDFLERQSRETGAIRASPRWFPSCSRLQETAKVLWALRDMAPGLYQFNANRERSFYEVVRRLKADLGKAEWDIFADDHLSGNQLMIDRRLESH